MDKDKKCLGFHILKFNGRKIMQKMLPVDEVDKIESYFQLFTAANRFSMIHSHFLLSFYFLTFWLDE